MTGIVLAANLGAGRLAQSFGTRRVIAACAVVAAASFAGLLEIGRSTPYFAMVAQLMVIGASIGVIVPLMTSEILGSVDRSYSGVASGTLNTARQTGSVIGVALFGSLLGAAGSSFTGGLHATLIISAALLLGTAALAARLPRAENRS
jgi:DHA2 family methylenomycin A resistance protein-like MFS transporter